MGGISDRKARIAILISEFPRFVRAFTQMPAFKRAGQLEYHLETIQKRRKLGSAAKALDSDEFVASLHRTLEAWGIGKRASKLKPLNEFSNALRLRTSEISALDGLSIDDAALDVNAIQKRLWQLIDTLEIVTNDTPIVSATKTLHHILPDLVVPMDRAYTQEFFFWHNPEFQYGQSKCFSEAFVAFADIARRVNPSQYLDQGWNSSRSKVIDNAIVAMVEQES